MPAAVLALSAATASSAGAQTGRSCRSVLPSDFRRIVDTQGQEIVYFRDPVRFLCTGGVLLEADSAVMNRATSTVELIGNVVYQDTTRALRSEWANYLGRMEQLLARGSVELRDLGEGATVRGEQLNYLRETETRPEARMIVTGGRPYAILPPTAPAAGPDGPDGPEVAPPEDGPPVTGAPPPLEGIPPSPAAPAGEAAEDAGQPAGPAPDSAAVATEVWADRIELEGETVFRARGDVELRRGDMTGGGQEALFDQPAERMTLTGAAFVEDTAYRLEGEEIDAFLEGEGIREVLSRENARVVSEELEVDAQRVRIGFADGVLERLEAWNPDPAAAPRRARAAARDFRLRADSIDAQADSIGIRELRAVGRAYGEREVEDSVAPSRALPEAVAKDWIQGDTILGFFSRGAPSDAPREPPIVAGADSLGLPGPGEDTDSDEVVLERIVVVGGEGPALSLYRMADDAGGTRPAINFMKANRIILFMEQGDVARVEAEGPIEGLYLDPAGQEGGGRASEAATPSVEPVGAPGGGAAVGGA